MTSNEYKPKNDGWDFEGTHNEDAEGWDVPVEKKEPETAQEPVVEETIVVEEIKIEEVPEEEPEVVEPIAPVTETAAEPEVEEEEPEEIEAEEEPEAQESVPAEEVAEPVVPVTETAAEPEVEEEEPEEIEVEEEPEIAEPVAEPEVHAHSSETHIAAIPEPVRNESGERLYKRPSTMSQIFTIYLLQMKLYSKNKMTYMMFALVALIPAIVYSGYADQVIKIVTDMIGASLLSMSSAYLLILLPLFIVAIPAIMCGRLLSSEFKNRTVYFNFPLPMSRTTFFVGKFLASLTLCMVIFVAALAFAIYLGDQSNSDVAGAIIVCLSGVLAMAATAYGLGPLFKRGSTAFTLVLMIILPLILPLIFIMMTDSGYMSEDLAVDLMRYVTILPIYAPFQTFWLLDNSFGGDMKELMNLLSGSGFDPIVYLGTALVWSALFIILGLQRVKNKEL
jgi:hypothetical protein